MTSSTIFFDTIANTLLTQEGVKGLPRATVLLPNYHAAQPVAQELARVSGAPAVLLPQLLTLHDWVQAVPLAQAVTPDTCRATTLYQALRARRWFVDADLWGIAHELLVLLDELTLHHVTLPQDEADFLAQLEQAYQARSNSAMQFEARVVHELWFAMSKSGELDAARAQQHRLARLLDDAATPLYVLLASDLALPEQRFLRAYAERNRVTIFDLRQMSADTPHCALIHAALLGEAHPAASLPQQAEHLRTHFPSLSLRNRLTLFPAHSLEQEARAAEVQVRRWLLAGKQSIAIVAQDRLAARRVRALLERAQVWVRDETGWTFSTLAVSTVLMRWLDALQSDFYYQDLLDLLKSPFIFSDQPASMRKHTLYQFEQALRKHNVVAHLDAFFTLVSADNPSLVLPLARLRQAAECLKKSSDTLANWLHALEESLSILGVLPGLAADEAGTQLLHLLHTWQAELASDTTRFSRAEWRRWLALQLDGQTFRDAEIDSPVCITHLAATRWRSFDAVLLLGCDDSHLPSSASPAIWFNDAVRATLGLPVAALHRTQQRDDLRGLLALNRCVLATWQCSKNGEANLLSPYLDMLRTLHQLAYQDDLSERELADLLPHAAVRAALQALPDAARQPAPSVPCSLIPVRVSASGYNSLVACPYQFYARHVLKLNELDEVKEGVEKRDYGDWVHGILHRFHDRFAVLSQHPLDTLIQQLNDLSAEVFEHAQQRDYWAGAWLMQWQHIIPVYLAAQLKREAEGWRYQSGEVAFELPLSDTLTLHGRIDRVDVRGDECSVLDYKTQAATLLRNKLKAPGEDVQLPCYAQVFEANTAAFISLEKDGVQAIEPAQDLLQLTQENTARLVQLFDEMRAGAGLPANALETACEYCEMRGVCRRGEWVG
jgi:ATP-dependent helicase/nuclease subunit B